MAIPDKDFQFMKLLLDLSVRIYTTQGGMSVFLFRTLRETKKLGFESLEFWDYVFLNTFREASRTSGFQEVHGVTLIFQHVLAYIMALGCMPDVNTRAAFVARLQNRHFLSDDVVRSLYSTLGPTFTGVMSSRFREIRLSGSTSIYHDQVLNQVSLTSPAGFEGKSTAITNTRNITVDGLFETWWERNAKIGEHKLSICEIDNRPIFSSVRRLFLKYFVSQCVQFICVYKCWHIYYYELFLVSVLMKL
jgi:hypothetical protein